MDPRSPVIVGVGQVVERDATDAPEPAAMIAAAARAAGEDAGADVLAAIDSVRIVSILSWPYRDAGAAVAARLGVEPADTAVSAPGGNSPQMLVNDACRDLMAGRCDAVLVGGGEAWLTAKAHHRAGSSPEWTEQSDDVAAARVIGSDVAMAHPDEIALGVFQPVQIYPLFEQALRHTAGRGVAEHQQAIGRLWAPLSGVAASNPYAWDQRSYTPAEIAEASADNRYVGYPYTKRMCANQNVQQAAALLLCTEEKADALGVPSDRRVYPWAGCDAYDPGYVSHRSDLHTSPALRVAGRHLWSMTGLDPDDVDHVDIYSCFPSAVQIAATELGVSLDRPLTVTGGLPFAGGPWNDYVTHAIATAVGLLRTDSDATALVTANGGWLAKHSIAVYGASPPPSGYRFAAPQAEIDAFPRTALASGYHGPAAVEAYTVMHGRDRSPEAAVVAGRTPDGARCWATSAAPDDLAGLVEEDWMGRTVRVGPDGALALR